MALSADGNTALVGNFCDEPAGATLVFSRSSGVWSQQGKLVGTGSVGDSFQGVAVALSADGLTALVGGYADNNDVSTAWIFTRNNGVWGQQGGKLMVSNAVGAEPEFGWAVSLLGDGNTALLTSPVDSNYAGATWVFQRSNSVWTEQSKLAATEGEVVAISSDGSTAIMAGKQAFVYTQNTSPPIPPALSISKTHSGNFTQGQNGGTYTIIVRNTGNVVTNGQVTVTENIPSGLSLVSMSGPNWNCSTIGNACARSDALSPGQN